MPHESCAGPVLYLAYVSTTQNTIPSQSQVYGYMQINTLVQEETAILQLTECIDEVQQ